MAALGLLSVAAAGCGNNYRPVVTATNPVGPALQPTKYAVVLSDPGNGTGGLLTFVDVSGDTVAATPSVQSSPTYLAVSTATGQGYTINQAGVLDAFSTSNPSGLLTTNIVQTTLASNALPVTVSPIQIAGTGVTVPAVYVPEQGLNRVAALNTSGQLLQEVSVPQTPAYVVGANGAPRIYSLSSTGGGAGTASAIESNGTGLSVTATIPVGNNPTYGVMTTDTRRAFILNTGSQSVSVINVVNNALDTGVPSGTITLQNTVDAQGNLASAANPVWADFNPVSNELVVLSAGDGVHVGVLTVISIPLCNAATQPTNPNCNTSNPVDAAGFGTIVAKVPVGINPTMVSVLQDPLTPRAYVSNSGSATASGSVSVVDLNAGVLTRTLPTTADSTNLATQAVFGLHPNTIGAATGDPTGKVYVTSPDSRNVTVIYTETDTVTTHIPLQGNGVRVVMNSR